MRSIAGLLRRTKLSERLRLGSVDVLDADQADELRVCLVVVERQLGQPPDRRDRIQVLDVDALLGAADSGVGAGGLAPSVADAIDGNGTSGWVPVAALTLGCSVVAAIAVATARETSRDSLQRIDQRTESRRAAAQLQPQRVERSRVTG